jgi:hypothetical protein
VSDTKTDLATFVVVIGAIGSWTGMIVTAMMVLVH